jgi:hypothetical protein
VSGCQEKKEQLVLTLPFCFGTKPPLAVAASSAAWQVCSSASAAQEEIKVPEFGVILPLVWSNHSCVYSSCAINISRLSKFSMLKLLNIAAFSEVEEAQLP